MAQRTSATLLPVPAEWWEWWEWSTPKAYLHDAISTDERNPRVNRSRCAPIRRQLPANPEPLWMGYSAGKWEGDTLVVDSIGFNDRTWLDGFGHPHSESMRILERFRRTSFGQMDIEVTINDPSMYTRPFTVKFQARLLPDTDTLESVCAENERDRPHLDK